MKTISIFGGTGYIGTYLSTILVKAGYNVRVFSRQKSLHTSVYCLPNIEYVKEYTYDNHAYLSKHLQGTDILINLIGTWDSNNKRLKTAHVDFPLTLYKIAGQVGIPHMMQISALGVGRDVKSKYLKTKFIAEQMLLKAAEGSNVRLSLIRPSIVVGHNDKFTYQMASYIRSFPVLPILTPNAKLQPVFIEDLAYALYRIVAGEKEQQVYEIAGPKVYTMHELVSLMATYIKGDGKGIIKFPDFLTSIYTALFGWVPGSPITRNQFLTAQTPSITESNDLDTLKITATPMESVLPFELEDKVLDKYFEDRLTARR